MQLIIQRVTRVLGLLGIRRDSIFSSLYAAIHVTLLSFVSRPVECSTIKCIVGIILQTKIASVLSRWNSHKQKNPEKIGLEWDPSIQNK